MTTLVHELILRRAWQSPAARALSHDGRELAYSALADQVQDFGAALTGLGIQRGDRVAVYLEKRLETVIALFAASAAGAVFVPVNPLLRPKQVSYILRDCNVRILVTSAQRLKVMGDALAQCDELRAVILVDALIDADTNLSMKHTCPVLGWDEARDAASSLAPSHCIDTDVATILYTSGSTGQPKGVILSHRNLLAGAESVANYLENNAEDCLLAVLPLSFDYGLSQLTTAFHVGASVVLMNYLLPRDVISTVRGEGITGLAAVPPLWTQLAQQVWPEDLALRYITNSGGVLHRSTVDALRKALPSTKVYLMYGLTEAFRSTYLPPAELDRKPGSIGRAIPNAEVMVLREDGMPCAVNEPGELVHRGALVALGYWNDPDRTAERFRPLPPRLAGLPLTETAVWSGDTVRMDEEGFLYFLGRRDDMIKVSGYRISPTEIEDVIAATGMATEAVAMGVPHPQSGQAIVVVALVKDASVTAGMLAKECERRLPSYMVPAHIETRTTILPRNGNGKIDRRSLQLSFLSLFERGSTHE